LICAMSSFYSIRIKSEKTERGPREKLYAFTSFCFNC